MIDNYDSFTYNLVQYFGELGQDVKVYRNDQITVQEIEVLKPQYIVISPGPCTPLQSGVSLNILQHLGGKVPILGVCLGHQAIGHVFGADIIYAKTLMHGKISSIQHDGTGVFNTLPTPLAVTRYHSLVIDNKTLPPCLTITAWTDDEEIMGVRHKTLPIEGIQFHPEAILTERGHAMLKNFLEAF